MSDPTTRLLDPILLPRPSETYEEREYHRALCEAVEWGWNNPVWKAVKARKDHSCDFKGAGEPGYVGCTPIYAGDAYLRVKFFPFLAKPTEGAVCSACAETCGGLTGAMAALRALAKPTEERVPVEDAAARRLGA